MVAPRVYEALRQPVVGHLDPYFFQVADDIRKLLGYVFSTANEFNIAISGTGTSGMEAAVANFAEPGEQIRGAGQRIFRRPPRRDGPPPRRRSRAAGKAVGRGLRATQEARDFIRREKPRMVAYRAGRNIHRRVPARQGHLRGRARSGRAGHRRLRHVAGRHAGAGGRDRNRHRLQLHAEGARLPAGTLADDGFARARWSGCESAPRRSHSWYSICGCSTGYYCGHKYHHTASATLFYALREGLAIVAKKGSRTAGSATAAITWRSLRASKPWACACTSPTGHRLWTLNTPRVPEGVDDAKVRQ